MPIVFLASLYSNEIWNIIFLSKKRFVNMHVFSFSFHSGIFSAFSLTFIVSTTYSYKPFC